MPDRGAPLVQATVTTERLRLAPLDDSYLDRLVELDADPLVMRFINGGVPSSLVDVTALLARTRGSRWAGHLSGTGEFVGWFALDPGADREYELGYRLRREHWGAGLASEGAAALVDHAFADLGARRVWGQTMTVNRASRRVLERCGMTYVRTFFADWGGSIEGSEHGDVVYELRLPPAPCP